MSLSSVEPTDSFICFIYFFTVLQIADLANEDTPQLYVACGRGPRSTLRVLRHGLEVCVAMSYISEAAFTACLQNGNIDTHCINSKSLATVVVLLFRF